MDTERGDRDMRAGFHGIWLSAVLVSMAIVRAATVSPASSPGFEVPAPDSDLLVVRVLGHDDRPVEVRLSGCVPDTVIRETRFQIAPDRPCSLTARRKDGAYWTSWTVAQTGQVDTLLIELPTATHGGLGAMIHSVEHGAFVDAAPAGSPAQQAGLEAGDIIVEANGIDLTSRSVDDLVALLTGPEGTLVDLDILDVRTGGIAHRSIRRSVWP